MPPLNNIPFDEPLLVYSTSRDAARSDSPSSFDRELGCEDPQLKFAFPPRGQKSVSFNHQVEVEYIRSHHDWTEDERASRWNSDDDYTHFQHDIFNTIYLLRNDPNSVDDICHSSRGVECRDPIVRRRRRQLKKEAWNVVFERQRIQRQTKSETNGYIYLVASMYCHAVQPAMRSALDFGAQDEIYAIKIRTEDNRCRKEETEFFNHSWMGTNIISSHGENSSHKSMSSNDNDDFGFCVFGEKSEFDDSWLRLEI